MEMKNTDNVGVVGLIDVTDNDNNNPFYEL